MSVIIFFLHACTLSTDSKKLPENSNHEREARKTIPKRIFTLKLQTCHNLTSWRQPSPQRATTTESKTCEIHKTASQNSPWLRERDVREGLDRVSQQRSCVTTVDVDYSCPNSCVPINHSASTLCLLSCLLSLNNSAKHAR
jgi:hypothetical protein